MSGEIKKVGVVGLGLMGFDIAFLYAMKGLQTQVYDASETAMESLRSRRDQTIERLKRRNRISECEIANLQNLLILALDLSDLKQADLITEAVSENAKIKLAVYQTLQNAGFTGILTTNTSSVTRATLVVGGEFDGQSFALTHFFNPVLFTRMVEVVKGNMNHADGANLIAFLKRLGRDPVETRDISGFVSNGILMIYAVMALRLLECGARIEQVDKIAKKLRLLPPFLSFDSWKPSIVEDVTKIMFGLRGDAFLRSSKLLTRMAKDNSRFYFDQTPNPKIYELAEARGPLLNDESVGRALRASLFVAAVRVAELGESPATVDLVAKEGLKLPQAPLREIDAHGAEFLMRELATIDKTLPGQPLPAPRLLAAMAEERQSFYKNGQTNPWLESRVEH
ncbi:MAG: 3-hydroxyacyl-CoA dehydrogenase family protein [Deltaproteobacteria bacterium]|nr:3-hydroxyacyl-CoA dehydrogenase family protein [Deltaproteobacteria bacterium]